MIAMNPIGFFRTTKSSKAEASHQGTLDSSQEEGVIELSPGHNFEQAVTGLQTCDRIWILYYFHNNESWKPMVQTPRGKLAKVGVFASRSPYRPNGLGLSCVRLNRVEGLKLYVSEYDLLDQTPILDIKPYLAYADSFPEAECRWLKIDSYQVSFAPLAQRQVQFLTNNGLTQIHNVIVDQLQHEPILHPNKRTRKIAENQYVLSYKTWRAWFAVNSDKITVECFKSGYTDTELLTNHDPYQDKDLHRQFLNHFPTSERV